MFVNSVMLAQFIIFFDAKSLFMLNHSLHAYSPFSAFVSKHFNRACLAPFSPKYKKKLPFARSFLISLNF
jgi:hypothetical protein